VAAGFVDFEVTWRADVFSGAPQCSSAANFGTLGINFRARKSEQVRAGTVMTLCYLELRSWLEVVGVWAGFARPNTHIFP
jgi:hypothetical protein